MSRDHGRHVPFRSGKLYWLKPKTRRDTFLTNFHIIFCVRFELERVIIKQPPPCIPLPPTPPCFVTAKAVHI